MTMPDEPSGYELQRSIEALRGDIRSVVATTVNAGVHAADLRRIEDRLNNLKEEISDLQTERERDRAIARNAKQWAVGIGVSMAGVIVALVAIIGDRI